ncbi:Vs.6 conserved hypothetical protein [Aeromonas phage Aeh1]|uniref:Glycine radical domain-containing protein n=1 Tax=Aeromonas phage Aeh1 TaxID=2880362 RepID=Q76Z52_9CAUD|nr:Vs.6 conserved hypothetical protein [Aeromonas phage Aeh1]AAQ17694.1 Vs.6 conserved hypothetical protein [Aeromonas phage Aeh1]
MKAIQIMSGHLKGAIMLYTPEAIRILVAPGYQEDEILKQNSVKYQAIKTQIEEQETRDVEIESVQHAGQHLNVNVLSREHLMLAIEDPNRYPNLVVRISGYAVRFNALTPEQQRDIVTRTFTKHM